MASPHAAGPAASRWSVALVVIARDEATRLPRLLASAAPFVDRVLVLDTGSRDDTVAVARAAGARVERFAWCDDFAAARNAALERCAADWHVVLDADEWVLDGGALLGALRQVAPEFVGALCIQDRGAASGGSDWISRVLPGTVRYAGRVHEQPQHALPVRRLDVTIGHDGYAPERMAAKRGRNRELLQAELARAPDDAYLWYQLGKDHAVYDEHPAAAAAFERAQALLGAAPWRFDLAARQLYTLKRCARHADALDLAERLLPTCGDSPDVLFALGDLMLDWAALQPEHAGERLALAEQAWQRCLALGERPDLPGAVPGRGSWLAAHNLAVVYELLGHTAQAAALRARYPGPSGPARDHLHA
jgi:tetratricopeptide (TPR) repeat protein